MRYKKFYRAVGFEKAAFIKLFILKNKLILDIIFHYFSNIDCFIIAQYIHLFTEMGLLSTKSE
jgi:hypothetical protein